MNSRLSRAVATSAAVAISVFAGTQFDVRDAHPADAAQLSFGGNGSAGGNAADRAHRDLLDHGPHAKLLTAAHRGQWRDAPENSLPGMRAAFDKGAEMVELDVQLTKDGVPVVMHDTSVNRTTNGTGDVSSFTLAELKQLRLRQGLGGAQAAVTNEPVPTLAEAMNVAKDRGLVNLDKAWPYREQTWQVLVDTHTIDIGLFKSDASVPEVQAFRTAHPSALYMHILTNANMTSVDQFGADQPVGYEVQFGSQYDPVARKPFLDRVSARSRIFVNAMWYGLADHFTDEASLVDPRRGWEALVTSFDASIIQTDDVEKFERWQHTGVGDPIPDDAIRIQAEDFLPGEGVGYHDAEAQNQGGLAMRPGEGVDIQDADGNVRVSWMRGGEWLTYAVDVPKTRTYTVAARASSPYSPAGTYTLSFDGGAESQRVPVLNTTDHNKEVLQPSGVTQRLTAGRHIVKVSLPADAFQNWNLDYLQLTPVGH